MFGPIIILVWTSAPHRSFDLWLYHGTKAENKHLSLLRNLHGPDLGLRIQARDAVMQLLPFLISLTVSVDVKHHVYLYASPQRLRAKQN